MIIYCVWFNLFRNNGVARCTCVAYIGGWMAEDGWGWTSRHKRRTEAWAHSRLDTSRPIEMSLVVPSVRLILNELDTRWPYFWSLFMHGLMALLSDCTVGVVKFVTATTKDQSIHMAGGARGLLGSASDSDHWHSEKPKEYSIKYAPSRCSPEKNMFGSAPEVHFI